MNRRKFLFLSGAGIVIVGTSYYLIKTNPSLGNSVFVPQYLPIIMDAQMIEEIGEEYLSLSLPVASKDEIKGLLSEIGVDSSISSEELNTIVAKDFKDENTILGKGWVLSETEVLQCASYSINN